MYAFTAALKSIMLTITLNPASQPIMAITIVLGLVAAWFGFKKTVEALKFPMNSGWQPPASLIIFIIFCLAGAALSKVFIAPKLPNMPFSRFIPLISAVIILLSVVVPLACFFMKSKYFQTLGVFIVPVIAAAIAAFLIKGIAGTFTQGEKGFSTAKERTEGITELLQ